MMTIELLPMLEKYLEGHVEGVKSLVKLTCACSNLHFATTRVSLSGAAELGAHGCHDPVTTSDLQAAF